MWPMHYAVRTSQKYPLNLFWAVHSGKNLIIPPWGHNIGWKKCISHPDEKSANYRSFWVAAGSIPSAAQLMTHCSRSALLLRTVWLINVVHYAQDTTGITTLIFLVYMRDNFAFPKMVNSIDTEVSFTSISISMVNSQQLSRPIFNLG